MPSRLPLECQECLSKGHTFFSQKGEQPFECKASLSCDKISCDSTDGLCVDTLDGQCVGTSCRFQKAYLDGSQLNDYFAEETFTWSVINHKEPFQQRLYFGCGIDQKKFHFDNKNNLLAAGIMGMSQHDSALPNQIIYGGILSHCLQHGKTSSSLTFGRDLNDLEGFKSIPLLYTPGSRGVFYYVELGDVGINGQWLHVRKSSPALMDTGTVVTRLMTPFYKKLHRGLESIFGSNMNLERTYDFPDYLCYRRKRLNRNLYDNLPVITLSLGGQEFQIQPEGTFNAVNPQTNILFVDGRQLSINYYRCSCSNKLQHHLRSF